VFLFFAMSTMKKKNEKSVPKKGQQQTQNTRRMRQRPNRPPRAGQRASADQLLRAQGVRGTDVRAPSATTVENVREKLSAPGSTSVMPIVCDYYQRSVAYLSMGIVLKAMQLGFKPTGTTFEITPYYAFRYIVDVMESAMAGTIPQIQQAPRWFWDLLYALKAKTVSYKTGQVKLSWNVLFSGYPLDVAFPLGTSGEAYSIFWGISGTSTFEVNEIPTLVSPPPYDPTSTQGPDSFNAMLSKYTGGSPGKLIGDPGMSAFDNDSSAFAACYAEIGTSFFGQGGLKNSIQSERHIDSPILAKFATFQQTNYRGWQQEKVSGGTASYLGARSSELNTLKMWRNKTPPVFKFYNFDEFFFQLSKILALALENANPNVLPGVKACPLTPLQAQLVLRQTLLPYFSNEMAQDMRVAGPEWVDMLPFTVGPNGVNYGRLSVNVPTFLAENIKCVSRLTSNLRGRGVNGQVIDIVPVLARPSERSPLRNFTYGTEGALVYAIPVDEVPVNLIDLSAIDTATGNVYYLDLNTEPYAALVTAWNEWISTLQPVLSSLVSLTGAQGARALATSVFTEFQREAVVPEPTPPPVVDPQMKKKQSMKRLKIGNTIPRKAKGIGAAPEPGSSYLNAVADYRVSGSLGFNSEIWSFLQHFILPISWSDANGTFAEGLAIPQAVQAFQCEPHFIEKTTANLSFAGGVNCITADERLSTAAAIDVKGVTQDGDHELIQQLKELTAKGEGGFFANIAGLIGEAFGVKGVGVVAESLGF